MGQKSKEKGSKEHTVDRKRRKQAKEAKRAADDVEGKCSRKEERCDPGEKKRERKDKRKKEDKKKDKKDGKRKKGEKKTKKDHGIGNDDALAALARLSALGDVQTWDSPSADQVNDVKERSIDEMIDQSDDDTSQISDSNVQRGSKGGSERETEEDERRRVFLVGSDDEDAVPQANASKSSGDFRLKQVYKPTALVRRFLESHVVAGATDHYGVYSAVGGVVLAVDLESGQPYGTLHAPIVFEEAGDGAESGLLLALTSARVGDSVCTLAVHPLWPSLVFVATTNGMLHIYAAMPYDAFVAGGRVGFVTARSGMDGTRVGRALPVHELADEAESAEAQAAALEKLPTIGRLLHSYKPHRPVGGAKQSSQYGHSGFDTTLQAPPVSCIGFDGTGVAFVTGTAADRTMCGWNMPRMDTLLGLEGGDHCSDEGAGGRSTQCDGKSSSSRKDKWYCTHILKDGAPVYPEAAPVARGPVRGGTACVVFNPYSDSGDFFACREDGLIQQWSLDGVIATTGDVDAETSPQRQRKKKKKSKDKHVHHLRNFRGHVADVVWAAVPSSHRERLISVGRDGMMFIWDISTGSRLYDVPVHESLGQFALVPNLLSRKGVVSVFSGGEIGVAGGKTGGADLLVGAGSRGVVRAWRVDTGALVAVAGQTLRGTGLDLHVERDGLPGDILNIVDALPRDALGDDDDDASQARSVADSGSLVAGAYTDMGAGDTEDVLNMFHKVFCVGAPKGIKDTLESLGHMGDGDVAVKVLVSTSAHQHIFAHGAFVCQEIGGTSGKNAADTVFNSVLVPLGPNLRVMNVGCRYKQPIRSLLLPFTGCVVGDHDEISQLEYASALPVPRSVCSQEAVRRVMVDMFVSMAKKSTVSRPSTELSSVAAGNQLLVVCTNGPDVRLVHIGRSTGHASRTFSTSLLIGHTGAVLSVAVCPFAPWIIATTSTDRTVRVWALSSLGEHGSDGSHSGPARPAVMGGVCLAVLRGHMEAVTNVAFSQVAPAAADHSVFDAADNGVELPHAETQDWFVVSVGEDKCLRKWSLHGLFRSIAMRAKDVQGGQQQEHPVGAYCVRESLVNGRHSHDSCQLPAETAIAQVLFGPSPHAAVGSDACVDGVECPSWVPVEVSVSMTLRAHDDGINCVEVSPNNQLIATASRDRTIALWNCQSLREARGDDKGRVRKRRGKKGKEPSGDAGQQPTPDVGSMAMVSDTSHDPHGLAAAFKRYGAGASTNDSYKLRGHKRGIWTLSFSGVERVIASGSQDGTIRIWSLTDGSCLRMLEGHSAAVLSVRFLRGSAQIVSSGADGMLKLWNVRTGQAAFTADVHCGTATDGDANGVVAAVEHMAGKRKDGQKMRKSRHAKRRVERRQGGDSESVRDRSKERRVFNKVWGLAVRPDVWHVSEASGVGDDEGLFMRGINACLVSGGEGGLLWFWCDNTMRAEAVVAQRMSTSVRLRQGLWNAAQRGAYADALVMAVEAGHHRDALNVLREMLIRDARALEKQGIGLGIALVDPTEVLASPTRDRLFDPIVASLVPAHVLEELSGAYALIVKHSSTADGQAFGARQIYAREVKEQLSPEAKQSLSRLARVLLYAREWCTRTQYAYIACRMVCAILRRVSPAVLVEFIELMGDVIRGLLPYTDRHLRRMDTLVQQSHVLDLAVSEWADDSIRGHGAGHLQGDAVDLALDR